MVTMRNLILPVLALCVPAAVTGQAPASCSDLMGTGQTIMHGVVRTPDDGALCVGRTLVGGTFDLLVVRVDAMGDTVWARVFAGPGNEDGNKVILRDDNTVIICGRTSSVSDIPNQSDLWVLAVDLNGDLLWHTVVRNTGNDYGFALAPTSDGGCLVTGLMEDGAERTALVRLDATGHVLWSRRCTTAGWGSDIVRLYDGGYAVVGVVMGDFTELDQFVMRLDSAGNVLWSVKLIGPQTEQGSCIIEEQGGTLLVGGTTYASDGDPSDLTLTRLDSTGAFLWGTSINNFDGDWIVDLVAREDGSALGLGYSYAYGPESALLLRLVDTALTASIYTAPDGDLFLNGMDNASGGGLWMCGYRAGLNIGRIMRLDASLEACPDCATRTPVAGGGVPLTAAANTLVFDAAGTDTTFALSVTSLDVWMPRCLGTATRTDPPDEASGSWIAPGSGNLRIAPRRISPYAWTIVDVTGRVVASGRAEGNAPETDTGFNGRGVHLLRIQCADGARRVERFFRP